MGWGADAARFARFARFAMGGVGRPFFGSFRGFWEGLCSTRCGLLRLTEAVTRSDVECKRPMISAPKSPAAASRSNHLIPIRQLRRPSNNLNVITSSDSKQDRFLREVRS